MLCVWAMAEITPASLKAFSETQLKIQEFKFEGSHENGLSD